MTYPDVAQRSLYDVRDNESYVVRKLNDGNCWMTSNLALQVASSGTYTDYGYNYLTDTTFDLKVGDANLPTWTTCASDRACAFNSNTIAAGGFYSWYAATAGKGTATQAAGDDIPSSICPKGWRLPSNYTIEPGKSYGGLLVAYGMPATNVSTNYVSTLEAVPLSFLRAGEYFGGLLFFAGTDGHYWSSTASGAGRTYFLWYSTSDTYPQDSLSNHNGFPVRCVAR